MGAVPGSGQRAYWKLGDRMFYLAVMAVMELRDGKVVPRFGVPKLPDSMMLPPELAEKAKEAISTVTDAGPGSRSRRDRWEYRARSGLARGACGPAGERSLMGGRAARDGSRWRAC